MAGRVCIVYSGVGTVGVSGTHGLELGNLVREHLALLVAANEDLEHRFAIAVEELDRARLPTMNGRARKTMREHASARMWPPIGLSPWIL